MYIAILNTIRIIFFFCYNLLYFHHVCLLLRYVSIFWYAFCGVYPEFRLQHKKFAWRNKKINRKYVTSKQITPYIILPQYLQTPNLHDERIINISKFHIFCQPMFEIVIYYYWSVRDANSISNETVGQTLVILFKENIYKLYLIYHLLTLKMKFQSLRKFNLFFKVH